MSQPKGDLTLLKPEDTSGYLLTTALLATILGIDGAGSGIDADKLDGKEADVFPSGDSTAASTSITDAETGITKSGFYTLGSPYTNGPTAAAYMIIAEVTSSGRMFVIAQEIDTNNTWVRYRLSNGTWGSWKKLWNDGNDGAGSNLDADKLDGNEGTYYAPKWNTTASAPGETITVQTADNGSLAPSGTWVWWAEKHSTAGALVSGSFTGGVGSISLAAAGAGFYWICQRTRIS
jgi:hypothetical protein